MEAYPNPTPYRGHRSQAHKERLAAVAHILKRIVQLENKDSLMIVHNCFPFDKHRKWSLPNNGCELWKARKMWYKEYLHNPMFFNVEHYSNMEQGFNTLGVITTFNFPKKQFEERQSYVR